MFLSYILIYFSAWKGVKSTGKIVYLTCTAPYIILTILLAKGLFLEGSGEGIAYLLKPRWNEIRKPAVWHEAAIQILFSSSVSFGPLMFYGSRRRPDEKIIPASVIIPLANSLTSIFAALTIFTFLGHVSHVLGKPIQDISDEGLDLAFVAYPGLIYLLNGHNFWALVFFLMLLALGIDTVFALFDFYQQFILEMFPTILQKISKELFCLILTTFCFFCSLIFCT